MMNLGYDQTWNTVLITTPQREYCKAGNGAEKGTKISIEQLPYKEKLQHV